jgi:hypothetical protein
VVLDKVEQDTHGAFDATTHEYVIPVSGQYVIVATVGYSEMDKGRANNEIRINAVNQTAVTTPGNSSGTGSKLLRVSSTTAVHLEKGDHVSLRTFHDYGTPRDLMPGLRETNLQIVRVPDIE